MQLTCICCFITCFGHLIGIVKSNTSPVELAIQTTCRPGNTLHDYFANVALNKNVTSSDYLSYPDKLLDGNLSNIYPCTHTMTDDYFSNYMLVDLGKAFHVYGVYLLNRRFRNEGLRDVEVYLGETSEDMVLFFVQHRLIKEDCTFVFEKPILARYVKVAKRGLEYLTLCELEVYSMAERRV